MALFFFLRRRKSRRNTQKQPPVAELSGEDRNEMPVGALVAEKKNNGGGLYEAPGHDVSHEMYTPPVELPSENMNGYMMDHHEPVNERSTMEKRLR
jgi:hypothetical protein